MRSTNASRLRHCRWLIVVALAASAGCSRTQSTEARIRTAYETAGMKPMSLSPIAGKATIDGQPPVFEDKKKRLMIMLYDPAKPDLPAAKRPHVLADNDGQFRFSQDGIPAGHYVLTFAVLRRKGQGTFVGPDDLHNLYNDPDVNAKTHPEFVIEHKAPGKTDYEFNLSVAGTEPNPAPGMNAMTEVKPPKRG